MAQRRTTLFLDTATREAADQLANLDDCSSSEAIRRAVVDQRDRRLGVPAAVRRRRRKTLERLFELFEGHDAAAEVRRLKAEDDGF